MATTGIENLPEPLAWAQILDPVTGSLGIVTPAAISALLDPARVREASVSVPFELWVTGRRTASFAGRAIEEEP